MYTGFLHLHDTLRWLILLSLIITLIKYLSGWIGNRPWKRIDNILGIVFTSLMDLQILTGLTLYFFLSPVTRLAFSDMGAAMKNPDVRFYTVEHFSMMLLAVALVHIGRAKSKKAILDISKFKIASIYFLIALGLIMSAIPWSRG